MMASQSAPICFGTTYYSLVGPACVFHVTMGLLALYKQSRSFISRRDSGASIPNAWKSYPCIGTSWMSCGVVVFTGRLRDRSLVEGVMKVPEKTRSARPLPRGRLCWAFGLSLVSARIRHGGLRQQFWGVVPGDSGARSGWFPRGSSGGVSRVGACWFRERARDSKRSGENRRAGCLSRAASLPVEGLSDLGRRQRRVSPAGCRYGVPGPPAYGILSGKRNLVSDESSGWRACFLGSRIRPAQIGTFNLQELIVCRTAPPADFATRRNAFTERCCQWPHGGRFCSAVFAAPAGMVLSDVWGALRRINPVMNQRIDWALVPWPLPKSDSGLPAGLVVARPGSALVPRQPAPLAVRMGIEAPGLTGGPSRRGESMNRAVLSFIAADRSFILRRAGPNARAEALPGSVRPNVADFAALFTQKLLRLPRQRMVRELLTVGIGGPVYLAVAGDATIRGTIESGRPGNFDARICAESLGGNVDRCADRNPGFVGFGIWSKPRCGESSGICIIRDQATLRAGHLYSPGHVLPVMGKDGRGARCHRGPFLFVAGHRSAPAHRPLSPGCRNSVCPIGAVTTSRCPIPRSPTLVAWLSSQREALVGPWLNH